MERSRLRAARGMRYALLNSILDGLVREGRIRIAAGNGWGFELVIALSKRAKGQRRNQMTRGLLCMKLPSLLTARGRGDVIREGSSLCQNVTVTA